MGLDTRGLSGAPGCCFLSRRHVYAPGEQTRQLWVCFCRAGTYRLGCVPAALLAKPGVIASSTLQGPVHTDFTFTASSQVGRGRL